MGNFTTTPRKRGGKFPRPVKFLVKFLLAHKTQ